MTLELRRYATLVRIFTEAPTPELSFVALRGGMFHDLDGDDWYGVEDAGVISGGEIVGDPEDLGPSEWGDALDIDTVFPGLAN